MDLLIFVIFIGLIFVVFAKRKSNKEVEHLDKLVNEVEKARKRVEETLFTQNKEDK